MKFAYPIVVLIFALSVLACGGTDYGDPRQVVIAMFGAMEKDDQAALAHLLDIESLMLSTGEDYAFQTENPRTFVTPQEILEDLTGEGQTKTTWFRHQRIVNEARITGETATVEVTFVDQEASRGYLTSFGLHKKGERWKIFSFKTLQDSPTDSE